MQPVSAFVVFVIIWWLVIFCVLPIGLSNQYEKDDAGEEGLRYGGAPKNLNIKKKFILTTVISFVLWVIILAFIMSGIIDFREIAFS